MRGVRRNFFRAVACALFPLVVAAPAQADRPFSKRFETIATGTIVYASNVLSTCANPPTTACNDARNATAPTISGSQYNNNAHSMVLVDVDSDPSTDNSSTAALTVPSGSSVLWAGLYWTATAPTGITATTAKAGKLKGPLDSSYRSVTATTYDPSAGGAFGYDCFVDVTDIVKEQGAGSWTFGGIPVKTGANTSSGWSLVVVYSKPGLPLRDLTVFDGQATVSGNAVATMPVSGFRTPAAGPVRSEVGFISLEGDRSSTGDYLQLDDTILTDPLRPANNTFNSYITALGAATTGRNPSYANQLGFDAGVISASGILANNATSAVLRAKTNLDAYMPIVFSFSTELYAPEIAVTKTVSDVNGGEVRVGDELEYEMTVTSSGDDGAVASVLREDAMPDRTEYVAGSLQYDPGTGYGAVTDASADDVGEAEGGTGGLRVRIGQGADANNGGLMAKGTTWKVKFRAKVTSLPSAGGKIVNVAFVDYSSQTLGSEITAESNEAKVTVRLPDAAISKVISSAQFSNGLSAAYTLTVSNRGDAATDGETVVTDALPVGFASPSVTSSPGWDCSIAGSDLTCKRSDSLEPGRTWPPIVITSPALVNPAGDTIVNGAIVDTPLDSDPTNDQALAAQQVGVGVAALPVAVSADVADVLPGDPVVFSGTFTNAGPSSGPNPVLTVETDGLTIADLDVTGFTVTSSDGSITAADCTLEKPAGSPIKVTCSKPGGSIAAGVNVQIDLTLVPRVGTEATEIKVKATGSIDNDPEKPRSATTTVPIVPTADLEITKQASAATVDPSQTVDFTLHVVNLGPASSHGIRVVDVVPQGLAVESAKWTLDGVASDVACQITGRTVECEIDGTLVPASGSGAKFVDVVISTRSDGTRNGPITNSAGVSSLVTDPFPDNDVAEATVIAAPWTALSVTKSGPASLKPGATGTFTMTVTNDGPSQARDVTLTDTLPAGMSVDPTDPLIVNGTCRVDPAGSRTVVCLLINDPGASFPDGALALGEKWTVALRVRISTSARPGSTLTNTVVADSSTAHDEAAATDSVRVTIATAASKRLGLRITTPRNSIAVGRRLPINVKVSAPRTISVSSVSLCVRLPRNVRYVSSSGRIQGGRVCWQVGTLKASASRSYTITVVARSSGIGPASAATRGSGASRVTDASNVRTHSFTG